MDEITDGYRIIRVWALGDTHLSFAKPKPMDIFGPTWTDHPTKIERNVKKLVSSGDILLIPGDLSWAMRRTEALPDLAFLANLPGIKIVCKGNHDYWWGSDKRLDFDGLNDTPWISDDGIIGVAGTRGWDGLPEGSNEAERAEYDKHVGKEYRRLEKRLNAISGCKHKFVMIHHPPLPEFVPLLQKSKIECIVYGHLHMGGNARPYPEDWMGLKCYCVAADRISFSPRLVSTLEF